ncbi:MAG: phage baseplate protein [Leptolyngbya sp. SIO4C5]|nr:phage baseplate protein [Leptolyngbya sp. SIO4C5]
MGSLSAAELLTLWEQGLSQPDYQRALLLLAAAYPEEGWPQLARLSLGQRDGLLLNLREQLFGPRIVSVATCPHCGDRLELVFTAADVRQPAADLPLTVETAGYRVDFRLPNSEDLAAIASQVDLTAATRQLRQRCLQSAHYQAQPVPTTDLPQSVTAAILAQMEAADPQADIRLALDCPACAHHWQLVFDVVSFFWAELTVWAKRLLQEIHLIATAYGWPEADILALSSQRRQLYLEMIYG